MSDDDRPTSASESSLDDPRVSLAAQLRVAAGRAGIGQVAPGEVPTASALLAAIGGVRGLAESILPGLGFVVVYALTGQLLPSVLIPVGVAVLFVVARAVQRGPIAQALAGVFGIAISAAIALLSGRAEGNFVPGLVINAVSLLALVVSIVVRWPLIGVIVGLLTNEGAAWRADRAKRRVLQLTTGLWCLLFAARLAVQLPLFFSGEITALATTKLLMGVPLYAMVLWVTWLLVRTVYRGRQNADAAAGSTSSGDA
ncbi:DUF3159 domain-containing protein [Frigoribacterium faeni]|uniref:DUF3159 domain-containing protein n=1 Tax=Frigoribacterium faeni TaxID=145483 RepID=A0A7W3JH59_9MICO|nr:DUF3159 domain-containing protein [Frigoribacterium faeni]MBA8812792.1 hypothetical protein [Frigoribacterium faeni]BFF13916.1 DUF3159 domain-containing protein [Microbacterium flavescens]GEK82419.1 hypothetical protein FFA01_07280 [Frigoribacterium faeni]